MSSMSPKQAAIMAMVINCIVFAAMIWSSR